MLTQTIVLKRQLGLWLAIEWTCWLAFLFFVGPYKPLAWALVAFAFVAKIIVCRYVADWASLTGRTVWVWVWPL